MKVSIKIKFLIAFTLFPLVSIYLYSLITQQLITQDKLTFTYTLLAENLRSKVSVYEQTIRSQTENHRIFKSLFDNSQSILKNYGSDHQTLYLKISSREKTLREITFRPELEKAVKKALEERRFQNIPEEGVLFEVSAADSQFGFIKNDQQTTILTVFVDNDLAEALYERSLFVSGILGSSAQGSLLVSKVVPAEVVPYIKQQLLDQLNNNVNIFTAEVNNLKDKNYLLSLTRVGKSVVFTMMEKDKTLMAIHQLDQNTQYFFVAVVCISLILAVLLARNFSRPILELYTATKKIEEGNYDIELIKSGSDEISTLSSSFENMAKSIKHLLAELKKYNEQLEHLVQERTAQLQRAMTLQKAILESLGQGFFIFDKEGSIQEISSRAADEIFDGKVAGKQFVPLLSEAGSKETETQEVVEQIFNETLPFEDLRQLLPTHLSTQLGREIGLEYFPLMTSTTSLEGIIVVATDRSDELRFERLAKQEQAFSRLIIKILRTPTSFIKLYRHAEKISIELKKLDAGKLADDRDQILMELHGLKGAFSFYDFYDLQNILHDLESQLLVTHTPSVLQKKVEELGEKLNQFRIENADIFDRLILYRESELHKKYNFLWSHDFPLALKKDYIRELCYTPASESLRFLSETAQQLAQKYHKDLAPLEFSGQEIQVSPEIQSILFECSHLIRNSVIHGIEDSETRKANQKPAAGKISISINQLTTDDVKIVITDDGKGFDPKAFEESNFHSTNDVVTTDSGRGLGVNAVLLAVKKLNGVVKFESQPGRGTSFSFKLPLSEPSPNTDLTSF